jgi:hypothetical protein
MPICYAQSIIVIIADLINFGTSFLIIFTIYQLIVIKDSSIELRIPKILILILILDIILGFM